MMIMLMGIHLINNSRRVTSVDLWVFVLFKTKQKASLYFTNWRHISVIIIKVYSIVFFFQQVFESNEIKELIARLLFSIAYVTIVFKIKDFFSIGMEELSKELKEISNSNLKTFEGVSCFLITNDSVMQNYGLDRCKNITVLMYLDAAVVQNLTFSGLNGRFFKYIYRCKNDERYLCNILNFCLLF